MYSKFSSPTTPTSPPVHLEWVLAELDGEAGSRQVLMHGVWGSCSTLMKIDKLIRARGRSNELGTPNFHDCESTILWSLFHAPRKCQLIHTKYHAETAFVLHILMHSFLHTSDQDCAIGDERLDSSATQILGIMPMIHWSCII